MPKWFEKILNYNPGEKSLKASFAIYLDLECFLRKEQSRQNNNNNNNNNNHNNNNNNLEKSYAVKVFWLGNVYKMFIWWWKK